MTASYQNPLLGTVPIDFVGVVRLLRKVTYAYAEVIEQLYNYDEEHPELWASCSEHPGDDCGYRDIPDFFTTVCITTCDVRDAQAFLAALDAAGIIAAGVVATGDDES